MPSSVPCTGTVKEEEGLLRAIERGNTSVVGELHVAGGVTGASIFQLQTEAAGKNTGFPRSGCALFQWCLI